MATTNRQTIREYREARGWSQAELAFRSGVSPSTIFNWESKRFEPKSAQLRKVAKVFGVSMDAIDFECDAKAANNTSK